MAHTKASRHAISPNARAALFGSHHAVWRKEAASHPFYLPPAFADLMPEPLPVSLRIAAGAPEQPGDKDLLDATIAEATRLRRPSDNVLAFNGVIRSVLPQEYCDDLDVYGENKERRRCTCCRHAHGQDSVPLSRRSGPKYEHIALPSGPGVEAAKVVAAVATEHRPTIEFDADTWIATAKEFVTFEDVQAEEADRVFCTADPRDWDLCAPATFERTLAGRMKNGRFEKFVAEYHPIWEDEAGGYIFEEVAWDFNSRVEGGAQNILRFNDVFVEKRPLNGLDGDWKRLKGNDAIVAASTEGVKYEWRYRYQYDLHLCLGANLMGSFQPGGLDVDEGCFCAVWNEEKETLVIEAKKRLHYCQQPSTIQGFDLMMNLMAPALTGMFMRQMAVRGVAAAIEGKIDPRKKRNMGGLV
jgi:hypothetical protein